ncbi:hypothetical protein NBRC10512v2_008091 [Rhodotorula toruloides]
MTQHDALRQERGVAKGERGAVEWCEVREEKLEDMVGVGHASDIVSGSSGPNEALEYGSDHRPIRTVLAVERAERPPAYPRRLFRKADPAAILHSYAKLVASAALPATLLTPANIDAEAEALDSLLCETVLTAVPLAKPSRSRFAHRWWSSEVADVVGKARRART